jgi:hypothetical protein
MKSVRSFPYFSAAFELMDSAVRGFKASATFLFLVVKLLAIASMKEPPLLPASLKMISPGYQEVIK